MAASLLIMIEAAMDFIGLIEIRYSSSKGNLDTEIMLDLLIIAIALIFLHIGVAKSLIPFLFKDVYKRQIQRIPRSSKPYGVPGIG